MNLEERNCIKILWEVQSVKSSVGFPDPYLSRFTFPLDCLQNTLWVLEMGMDFDCVYIYFTRSRDDRVLQTVKLRYDIRLITTNGMTWQRGEKGVKDFERCIFKSNYWILAYKNELLNPDNGLFFGDSLKLSVRLWPTQSSLPLPISLHLRSDAGFLNIDDHTNIILISSPMISDNVGTSTDEIRLQSLGRDLSSSLDDNLFSDFEIRCGGQLFPVHKVVLCVRSPVFKAMLTSETVESSENSVDVPDFTPDTIRRLLRFLYSGTVADLDKSAAVDLYAAADKYSVLELRDLCSSVMLSGLCTESIPRILRLSDRHSDRHLKEKVISIVKENKDCVLQSPEWKSFMEEDPVLALEVYHDLNTKKRRC